MLRQIWIKEYIKLSKPILALFFLNVAVGLYHWLRLRSGFTLQMPVVIWVDIIGKQTIFFTRFETPLLLSAVVLGVMQFYPEVSRKRFRISCHLPVNEYLMTGTMVLFGISVVTGLWLFDLAMAYASGVVFFPREIYSEIPVIMFYWYIKAVIFYIFASMLTLEPSWKKKAVLAVLLLAYTRIITISVYNSSRVYIVMIVIMALIFIPTVYYPAMRFRKGAA